MYAAAAAANNPSAAAVYQNAAAAAGYAGPASMNIQLPSAAQYNPPVIVMPVNQHGVPQPAAGHAHQAYGGYPGRDGGPSIMYGGQPAGMMLAGQQGQRSGTVPQVAPNLIHDLCVAFSLS